MAICIEEYFTPTNVSSDVERLQLEVKHKDETMTHLTDERDWLREHLKV